MDIGQITGDTSARMEWKYYWRNVVQRYQVVIEGWPDNIPFGNLSNYSNSLADLEALLRKWRCGSIYWKEITDHELQQLNKERDERIERGEIDAPVPRRRRSDYGKKRVKNARTQDDSNGNEENEGEEE